MYIGSTGEQGLHHLVWEVVDNSVDEALAGFCDEINVQVHEDNKRHGNRQRPRHSVDMHATEKRPAAEVVMTVLHAGGKFDSETYKVSGGLHGVGRFRGERARGQAGNWKSGAMEKSGSSPTNAARRNGQDQGHRKDAQTGTKITFHPDPSIFEKHKYSYDILAQRCAELAFLNKGLKITLTDERSDKSANFDSRGGIGEFVKHLNKGKRFCTIPP